MWVNTFMNIAVFVDHEFQLVSRRLVSRRKKKTRFAATRFAADKKNSFRGNSFRGGEKKLVSRQLVSRRSKKTRFAAGQKKLVSWQSRGSRGHSWSNRPSALASENSENCPVSIRDILPLLQIFCRILPGGFAAVFPSIDLDLFIPLISC